MTRQGADENDFREGAPPYRSDALPEEASKNEPDRTIYWNISAVASIAASGLVVLSTIWIRFGIWPFYLSAREPGFDIFENTICFVCPLLLLDVVFLILAKPKGIAVVVFLVSFLVATVGLCR